MPRVAGEDGVSDIWRKLNLKDASTVFVLTAPSGFEGVRQVAIDEDWSALRFRRVQVHQDDDARQETGKNPGRQSQDSKTLTEAT